MKLKNKYKTTDGFTHRIAAEANRFFYRRKKKKIAANMRRSILSDYGENQRIGVQIRGGLGDHIVSARFLRDLRMHSENVLFDVYTLRKSMVDWLFKHDQGFFKCFDDCYWHDTRNAYPVTLELFSLVAVKEADINWQKVDSDFPLLGAAIKRAILFNKDYQACIKNSPLMDDRVSQIACLVGKKRHNFLQATCGVGYGGDALHLEIDLEIYDRYNLKQRRYVTVSDSVDEYFGDGSNVQTKSYPHFGDVIQRLKHEIPEIYVVQVGVSSKPPLPHIDISLLNQTSFAQVAGVLSKSALHIDNEGGLVHLAAALGRKSCVVFGPTPKDYFGYENNFNVGPSTCGNCYWLSETWMSKCLRHFDCPPCVFGVTPESVVEKITYWLRNNDCREVEAMGAITEVSSV